MKKKWLLILAAMMLVLQAPAFCAEEAAPAEKGVEGVLSDLDQAGQSGKENCIKECQKLDAAAREMCVSSCE